MEDEILETLKERPKTKLDLKIDLQTKDKKDLVQLNNTLQKLKNQGKLKLIDNQWFMDIFSICPTCLGKGWIENHEQKHEFNKIQEENSSRSEDLIDKTI